jgi:hypothetical protein
LSFGFDSSFAFAGAAFTGAAFAGAAFAGAAFETAFRVFPVVTLLLPVTLRPDFVSILRVLS